MTKGVVNIFDDDIDPTLYLNGLEAVVRLFGKVARTTSTINTERMDYLIAAAWTHVKTKK